MKLRQQFCVQAVCDLALARVQSGWLNATAVHLLMLAVCQTACLAGKKLVWCVDPLITDGYVYPVAMETQSAHH